MDADVQELIDGPSPRVQAARRLAALAQTKRHVADTDGAPSTALQDVHAGVTVYWLSKVFGMDPADVKRKLADCPVLHRRKAGYLYDLKQAAQYLVKPAFDVVQYIRTMKSTELPTQLQAAFWDAALKRQKWEENAGHLWRTEDVFEVLGDVFKTLKTSIQLWADTLEQTTGLSDEQRAVLIRSTDALQDEMYRGLVEISKRRQTKSMAAEGGDPEKAQRHDMSDVDALI